MSDIRPIIIVPTYLEACNIVRLIRGIRNVTSCRILIVDDASGDGTANVIREMAMKVSDVIIIERRGGRSFGKSILCGLSWGLLHGHNMFTIMDADLSHSPEMIRRFWTVQAHYSPDLPFVVIGSRFAVGGRDLRTSVFRRLLSKGAAQVFRLASGLNIRDPTSGFRCLSAAAVNLLLANPPRADGFYFHIEMLSILRGQFTSIYEIPIDFRERQSGISKLNVKISVEWLCSMFSTCVHRAFSFQCPAEGQIALKSAVSPHPNVAIVRKE